MNELEIATKMAQLALPDKATIDRSYFDREIARLDRHIQELREEVASMHGCMCKKFNRIEKAIAHFAIDMKGTRE